MRSLVFCLTLVLLQAIHVLGNNNIPEFIDYEALNSRYLREDFPVGDVVGTITAYDPDGTNVFFDIYDAGSEYFKIGRTTGIVTLKKVLDFDTRSEREIKMEIRITDENGQRNKEEGKVFVQDVNDIPPDFDRYDIFESLPEDTKPGHVVANISVNDRDTTSSVFTVRCKASSEAFTDACEKFGLHTEIIYNSNRNWIGQIKLDKPLDYEQRISYAILLEATDGVHNVTNEVHIEVEDINDSPPIWTRIQPVTIDEETKFSTYITQVTATDGDATNPRDISYEIIGGNNLFGINNETGELTNINRIDYEAFNHTRDSTIQLKLRAREVISRSPLSLGNDAITTSTAVVTISIKDIDDNTPTFDQKEYTAFVKENVATGSNVPGLQMTITDIDSGLFNSFDLVILNHQDIFDIVPKKGKSNAGATLFIKDGDLIDYETGPKEYTINVEARENEVLPALTGSAVIKIQVRDVNDQDPAFRTDTFERTIPETSKPGTVVIDLDATDNEEGNFGTGGMRYKLFGSLQDHFVIDPVTGVITVGNCATPGVFPCIDAERKKQSFLTVSATDNLGTGRTRSVQVIVTITDENDNIPNPDDKYIGYIIEGETKPLQPVLVKAIDPDTVGGPLSYELDGTPEVIARWKITPETDSFGNLVGRIEAKVPILYSYAQDAATGAVNFKVKSSDLKTSVSSDVTIFIIDINNNEPKFSKNEYETELFEDVVGERFVMDVIATDGDAPSTGNGIIDFSISDGALGKFTLKTKTVSNGEFKTQLFTTPDATFNYDKNKRYEMTVEARDQGTPESKRGSAKVIVNILDVNNNIPEITPSSVYESVPENEPVNTRIHTVDVNDPDKTADLFYYMRATRAQNPTGGNVDRTIFNYDQLFRIEEKTGVVRVNGRLNREQVSFIVYELTVEDRGASPVQTGTGALFLTITEVNDQDPAFEEAIYNISIDEELNLNYFVRNLHCNDEDDQIARYELTQTEPRDVTYFSIVADSGVMSISRRIDFEALEKIKLSAICVDDGTPARTGSTSIIVTIKNLNDNSPEFGKEFYRGQVPESKAGDNVGGTLITQVTAKDIDKGDYGNVRFAIPDNNAFFEIDTMSGEIKVKSGVAFDRERDASKAFQVIATDSPLDASVRRTTSVPVYITIADINDNCPKFEADLYVEEIPESAKAGTDIIDLIATDRDYGLNKLIVYTVQPGSFDPPESSSDFGIGLKSGRIYSLTSLTGKAGVYKFNVTATDREGENSAESCSTSVPVEVTVLPSENHAPSWVTPPKRDFVIYILESQYEGMLVYDCHAVDADKGKAGIIDYFFIEGAKAVSATADFRINQVTGIIRAEVEFDREQKDTYFLTLLARDQGATKATSMTTLTVVILDVDDNEPRFETKNGVVAPLVLPSEGELKEGDLPKGNGVLGKCMATDEDTDHENNKIYYKLLTADERIREFVAVDRETCEIKMLQPADYEQMPQLEFSIYAFNEKADDTVKRYERAVNPSILPVVLRITNINDQAPEFENKDNFACAPFASPFRSYIIDLDAHDVEQADTELDYSLEGTTQFSIDGQGIVRNAISFSSISDRIFSFNAQVFDGINSQSARVNVFVTSEDSQVKLKVDRPSSDVRRISGEYQELLVRPSTGIDYVCVDVRNHIADNGKISSTESDVYVSALRWNDEQKRYEYWSASNLYDYIITERQTSTSYDARFISEVSKIEEDKLNLDEDVVLAILIITIILIILAILLFCLACYCIWHKKKRKVKKVKARRYLVAANTKDTNQESYENPVYHNSGYVAYEDDYSTVSKVRQDSTRSPIVPVVIPVPDDETHFSTFHPEEPEALEAPEVPEYHPEEDVPVVETEVLPADDEEPVIETVLPEDPSHDLPPEPEADEHVETVIDDEAPLPEPPADEEFVTEIRDQVDEPQGLLY